MSYNVTSNSTSRDTNNNKYHQHHVTHDTSSTSRHHVTNNNEATSREIRMYHAPPDHVRRTMSAILSLCGFSRHEADDWRAVRRALQAKGDHSLVSRMSGYDVTAMQQGKRKSLIRHVEGRLEGVTEESVSRVSKAAVGYFLWAQSALQTLVKATDTTQREKVSCGLTVPQTTVFWNRHLRVVAYRRMLS